MTLFRALGERVRDQWALRDHDTRTFSEVAVEALRRLSPDQAPALNQIVQWIATTPEIPPQADLSAQFGQPPLTLYAGAGFRIDALFWHTATTSIHQHGFAGAFSLLAGASIQCCYEFEIERRISTHLLVGELKLVHTTLLKVGDVSEIVAGTGLIHSVFHLDTPSVTLVVRTDAEVEHQPQYHYDRPYVAVNPHYADPLTTRRIQILDLLRRTRPSEYEQVATEMLAHSDLFGVYRILQSVAETGEGAVFHRLKTREVTRRGNVVDLFDITIGERLRLKTLAGLRRGIQDGDRRFALAVASNAPTVAAARELAGQRFGSSVASEKLASLLVAIAREQPGVPDGPDGREEDLLRLVLEGWRRREVFTRMLKQRTDETEEALSVLWARMRASILVGRFVEEVAETGEPALGA